MKITAKQLRKLAKKRKRELTHINDKAKEYIEISLVLEMMAIHAKYGEDVIIYAISKNTKDYLLECGFCLTKYNSDNLYYISCQKHVFPSEGE